MRAIKIMMKAETPNSNSTISQFCIPLYRE